MEISVAVEIIERQVAGAEQADVDLETVLRANGAHNASGKHFGQLGLQVFAQPVDLVEHQRAAIAMLQCADLPVECAGKGVLLMAEQDRFDRVGGYPAHIYQAERGLGAGACGVHRAQQHFLAGAAFTLDQHVAVVARGLGGFGQCSAEIGRGADHRFEIEHRGELFGQWLEFVLGRFALGRAAQCLHQPVGCDRLDKVVGRPGTHRLHRKQRRSAGGKDENRQRRAALL